MKKLLFLLICLSVFPLVSASGLVVQNISQITKIADSDYLFYLNITNADTVPFYNIFLDDSTGLDLSYIQIPTLSPGQTTSIPVTIRSNINYNGFLRIKGYYNSSSVGHTPTTTTVNVYPYYSIPCSFSIIVGDSVTFINKLTTTINLRDSAGTPIDGGTLSSNSSVTKLYSSPNTYSYRWYVSQWGFPEVCDISVLSDTGLVNSPEKDGLLNLDLRVIYNPTNISTNLLVNNYNLNFYDSDDGLISIINIGNYQAKNVTLVGEWLQDFSLNNFDLDVNKTKVISYKVKPNIYYTNQTNKTYIKNLKITGNFNNVFLNFSIFINYGEINTNVSSNSSDFLNWVCTNFPQFCTPQIIYKYVTGNENSTTKVPITDEQWRQYNLDQQILTEDMETALNYFKESITSVVDSQTAINTKVDTLSSQYTSENDARKEEINTLTMIFIIFIVFIIIGVLVLILFFKHQKNVREKLARF